MSEPTNIVNIDGRDRRPWAVVSREKLLRAAIAEIADRGYEHARLVDIAARADMTVGAIYNWFDDKAAMFNAALEFALNSQQESNAGYLAKPDISERVGYQPNHWLMLVAALAPRQGGDKGPTDAQKILLEALRVAWRDEDSQEHLQPQVSALLTQYEAVLQQAVDDGRIDGSLNVRLLARIFLAIPIGLSSLTLAGMPDIAPKDFVTLVQKLDAAFRPTTKSDDR
ncbi:MAG: TetR family transcriptional regulator [Actinobacteria bacterium]|nr:TetR family transcriptional regulator [Actinomycetota bacterium]NBP18325.1 TetR family transcriptional regulator [Actinomycetota bacterium]NDC47251.1 TetR family transcriptional regulator [Actinomycetota bacterium]NDE67783.1 TetR family transcriptional regulator [Actinomycetota bacterium]NDG77293.1 TetR family transcriptional regulator [Acidimicrobiia bacterium]